MAELKIGSFVKMKLGDEYIRITDIAAQMVSHGMVKNKTEACEALQKWFEENRDKWEGKTMEVWNVHSEGGNYHIHDKALGPVGLVKKRTTQLKIDKKLYNQGFGLQQVTKTKQSALAKRCLVPPFSTLNTREGDWVQRRRAWIKMGINSELGRKGKLTYNIPQTLADGADGNKIQSQTSIFDPVLCELAYRWWSRPDAVVLDPFAGGSVRGFVACVMGLKYYGIDLSGDQVKANREQVHKGLGKHRPKWVQGDSLQKLDDAPECDFILSCPPYGNLEVYSDEAEDISNMAYDRFLAAYGAIIGKAVSKLRNDNFIVWVVSNFRDKDTKENRFRDFVGDTVRAFEDAGAYYYNEIALINSVGTGAMRANTSFDRGCRKVVRQHQNVLVFLKGDHKAAAAKLPPTDNIMEAFG